ncbi:PilN domain-containing protein [Actinotalea subterranea]|uniref:PilN domain-containing protein n=1 Tax=Actinotalea subterranea TaxID=2607497 RepID=UPI0011EEB5C6|nr:fimbrial assembly protein [Actinotalea subterranea]
MSAPTLAPVRRASVPGAPPAPQVNLLPPEVRSTRQFGRVRGWLGVAILVTILLAGLMFVFAAFSATQAQNELAEVEEQNANLTAQQAEFAEVPRVLNQLKEATDARTLGMSTETVWRQYFSAIAATAPAGVSVDGISVTTVTPASAAPIAPTTDPLAPLATVGMITFDARSLTLPDTSQWVEQLAGVRGFTNPWFSSAQLADDDGTIYYQVSGTILLTADAYAERFVAEEES